MTAHLHVETATLQPAREPCVAALLQLLQVVAHPAQGHPDGQLPAEHQVATLAEHPTPQPRADGSAVVLAVHQADVDHGAAQPCRDAQVAPVHGDPGHTSAGEHGDPEAQLGGQVHDPGQRAGDQTGSDARLPEQPPARLERGQARVPPGHMTRCARHHSPSG